LLGKALAQLANTDDAYGQVWHVPTHKERYTAKDWVRMYGKEMGVEGAEDRIQTLPWAIFWLLSVFDSKMAEVRRVKVVLYAV
jgi:hypothetical protein